MEIPVYLFTGFLEAGKTKYIQETLEDPEFCTGEPTLLLVCEEGIEEYHPERFAAGGVEIRSIDELEDLTEEKVAALAKETGATRLIVEYNGMWPLQALDEAMPVEWPIYQEFMFADASTFMNYNRNMHPMVRDKLSNCELVVFNRWRPDYDKMAFRQLVRSLNRRCDIIYEDENHEAEIDDIVDPLPFDLEAKVVEIKDPDYAVFYRDLAEETPKYKGKTVRFCAQVRKDKRLPADMVVCGRQVMTCCVEDIRFAGLFVKGLMAQKLQDGTWLDIIARIDLARSQRDGLPVPVMNVISAKKRQAPDPELSALY